MSTSRHLSLPAHAAFQLTLGLAVMVAPLALGFALPAIVVGVVVGAVAVGLALGAAVAGIGSIDVRAHLAYDQGLALGLLGAAVVLALAGELLAALFFAVTGVAHTALNATTRYTAR